MAIMPIVLLPAPVLRQVAKPIENVDENIKQMMQDMLETMYDADGLGLAAPQVGCSVRIIVMDCADEGETPAPIKMANPAIIEKSETIQTTEEGCLSIPDHRGKVSRPDGVVVEYLDEHNEKQQMQCEGLLGVCVQHEIDHLDGILFIDYLSKLRKNIIVKKMTKNAKITKE